MENTVKQSMEAYMDSLRSNITTIKEQPENECCDAVEIKVLENVLGIMNAHFGDYDTFCLENKHMAEFLASIGFTPEQIAKIGDGGKPSLNIDELKIKDKCKRSAIGFFHSNFPEDLSTDKLWNKAKKGQLQVCEAYEYFGSDSLLKEMESLESLIISEVKHAISLIGSAK